MIRYLKRKKSRRRLFQLLNLDPYDKKEIEQLDGNAIIREVQQNPDSAARTYSFVYRYTRSDYPLHQAVMLGADVDVVRAIYISYPPAIKAKSEEERTVLHLAAVYRVPTEVMSLLIEAWPEAVRMTDSSGGTPLIDACRHKAPVEVVSMLSDGWPYYNTPTIIQYRTTPLHEAVSSSFNVSMETVNLLVKHHPHAVREKDCCWHTPLHRAFYKDNPLELILFLLERYPEAIRERDREGETPLSFYQKWRRRYDKDTEQILSYMFELCGGTMNMEKAKEMMNFVIRIKWWNGVVLIIDRYPPLATHIGINTKIFPRFLSIIGRCCSIKTLWHVVSNELDLIEGI